MRRVILAAVALVASGAGVSASSAVTAGTVPLHTAASPALRSIAPSKAAWYDASRPNAITPAAPMPGVAKTDLVVAGLTVNTSLLPLSLPIPTLREVTAYTALQFHIPRGATPGSLVLHLTGLTTAGLDAKLPSGVTPIACPATSSFKPGPQQPTSAAPKYDCSRRSTVGQLGDGGKAVIFPGISRLLDGSSLSVVILPGSLGLERLVFSAPGKDALSLLDFTLPASSSSPAAPVAPVTPAASPTASAPAGLPPVETPPAVPLPSGVAVTPSAPAPVIAPSSPAIVVDAASSPDDATERMRAVGLLVALVVATAWFSFTDRRRDAGEMGVGRFRSMRDGPPPTI
ncbi:MAG TPA: hypothetical protein VHB69_03385 [Mycobacteriales bacterium]|nr:hypothetical protein [Mycobacteriales bacterium]